MANPVDTAHGILIDHSPCLAEDVPLDGLAEDIAKAIAAERERCARIAGELLNGPTLLQRAGEMTLQEKRSVLAVVAAIATAIRGHH
jgi:hypothetical protein